MIALLLLLSFVFWSCVLLIGHTYALYPTLLGFLARGKSLPAERYEGDEELPEVAVLMAVYNEETVIEATLESILASDYPRGKMRIFIGSDGSTDRSDAIIRSFQERSPHLHLTVFGGRNGKIRILNRLAVEARESFSNPASAVFVLCDANVVWSPSLLRRLAGHFKRPGVGLVGAAVMDRKREHDGIGDQEEAYVGRENLAKYREGVLWGKVMGAFGACYALRVPLFTPVPENYIVDDFFLTMACLEKGGAAIVDLEAVCYESVSTDIGEEFRRKRRIATGNFQNLVHYRELLRPKKGNFATFFAFWSHKGLRWCGPFLLVGAGLSCLALSLLEPLYLVPLAGMAATVLAALCDAAQSRFPGLPKVKLFRFVRYFYSMNAALFLGYLTFRRGVRHSVWEPTKRVGAAIGKPEVQAKGARPAHDLAKR